MLIGVWEKWLALTEVGKHILLVLDLLLAWADYKSLSLFLDGRFLF